MSEDEGFPEWKVANWQVGDVLHWPHGDVVVTSISEPDECGVQRASLKAVASLPDGARRYYCVTRDPDPAPTRPDQEVTG